VNEILNAKFSKLENSRIQLLLKLKNTSRFVLETPPALGKWSVSQIFYHLNKAESFSTIYVSKKRLDVNNLKTTGFNEYIRMVGLKLIFVLPFSLKAPVNVLGDVPEKVDYKSITTEWNETRNKLKELLESLPDDILNKNVFKQPAIGRINVFQMLDFMQAHFNRHEKQVERITK
jgi:hypothetical protein